MTIELKSWRWNVRWTVPLALFAIVVVLLWLEDTPNRGRVQEVSTALVAGDLGGLSDEEQRELIDVLSWLLSGLERSEAMVVNGPHDYGSLHVYTVPDAPTDRGRFTSAGNAAYESGLDAIFIDVEIIRQTFLDGVFEGLTDEHIALQRIYLYFILAHEIGHWQLHDGAGGFLDRFRTGVQQRREIEADEFAVGLLEAAYAADRADGSEDFIAGAGPSLYLERQGDASDVWIDLGAMAQLMPLFQMHGDSPLSSLYSDASHRTFVERSTRLIEMALDRSELDEEVRAHLVYGRETLHRMSQCREHLTGIVSLPTAPIAVALSSDDFALATGEHTYRLPMSVLRADGDSFSRHFLSTSDAISDTPGRTAHLWFDESGNLMSLDAHGSTFRLDGDAWSEVFRAPDGRGVYEVYPCMGGTACFVVEVFESGELWYYRDGRPDGNAQLHALEMAIAEELQAVEVSASIAGFHDGALFLAVQMKRDDEAFLVAAQLALPEMHLEAVEQLNAPADRLPLGSWGGLIPLGSEPRPRWHLFGSDDGTWVVDEIGAVQGASRRASRVGLGTLLSQVAGPMAMALDPRLERLDRVDADRALVGYDDDSLYLFSAGAGSFDVVCHPGGLRYSAGNNGAVAFYEGEVGHKAFVADLNRESTP